MWPVLSIGTQGSELAGVWGILLSQIDTDPQISYWKSPVYPFKKPTPEQVSSSTVQDPQISDMTFKFWSLRVRLLWILGTEGKKSCPGTQSRIQLKTLEATEEFIAKFIQFVSGLFFHFYYY